MASPYQTLLDAAIDHLGRLKAGGVRSVAVSPETLTLLARPAARRRTAPSPTASLRPAPPAIVEAPPALRVTQEPSTPAGAVATPPAPLPAPARPGVTSGENREMDVAKLRDQVMVCQKCPPLAAARKNVVFGVGDITSPLMFVGEAPGADEDEQGEPFVGAAGQLLTKIIVAMGFTRETVYICNVLKCRPDTPAQAYGNRKPTSVEMSACLPYLQAQIELIQPRVIVALGGTAVEGLFGSGLGITKLRGTFQDFRGTPVMPTYHPAYLLRNQALSEKRKVWEDMLSVLEKLGRPITEKQRAYFSKSG